MPAAGRLGDRAQVPSDSHGGVCCAHGAVGPATAGSPNVNVNSKPSLRVGDPGVHSSCCGANKWNAKEGSPSVFVNGIKAHRMGDETKHCGGMGKLIEGSGNVNIGGKQGKKKKQPGCMMGASASGSAFVSGGP